MKLNIYLIIGILALVSHDVAAADDEDVQDQLRTALFSDYEKRHLPSHDLAHGVNFSMTLQKINSLDMFQGSIDLTAWMAMIWKDDRLQWDPAAHGDIQSFHVPTSDIWIPDLTLYNSDTSLQIMGDVLAVLNPDGTVYYIPPMRVKSTCVMDLEDFPYDTQVCILKWGSWTHDNSRITLHSSSDKVDLTSYNPNPVWEVLDTSAKRSVLLYFNGLEYEDVTISITVRRKESHGTIAAAVVTTWLVLAVFLIAPSSASDRITFAGFVFVSLVVLTASLAVEVPSYSVTSLGRFQLAGMLITAIIIVLNAIIHRFYPRVQPPPPSGDNDEPKLYQPPPSRIFLFIDIGAFLVTFIILAIATGALFG